jgi:hypothetical protein
VMFDAVIRTRGLVYEGGELNGRPAPYFSRPTMLLAAGLEQNPDAVMFVCRYSKRSF